MSSRQAGAWLRSGWVWLCGGLLVAALVYLPGLSGGWLFDDYPNIVDNPGVQLKSFDLPGLLNAALSSPSSDFKRPLASLSFALNYLSSGMDPPAMKATNLLIHLANGLVAFLLLQALLRFDGARERGAAARIAAVVATTWMLLSINLTSVLYVVQRMESLANLFVLLGLYAYVSGRQRMVSARPGLGLCVAGVLFGTGIGALAKETAVMLPLYALLCEHFVFGWARSVPKGGTQADRRIAALFLIVFALPLIVGAAWLTPSLLASQTWARRDFTLGTRLLSEARIVVDYMGWTLAPTPHALAFYHDDFVVSQGLLQPWTTLASIVTLATLIVASVLLGRRWPLAGMGIAWYLGCHLLTGTVLPLELVYEHRNYFASLGLLLAVFEIGARAFAALNTPRALPAVVWLVFVAWQGGLTMLTARSWGDPLSLARELAYRGPDSPRAQYELGRTYIIYSHYNAASPFIALARTALERAASIKGSSILPEQALIFMNSRMHRPVERTWWASAQRKLAQRAPTVQDESSLEALSACLRSGSCDFASQELLDAYLAALGHPPSSARLLAMYANFAWSTLNDRSLGMRMQKEAVLTSPGEPAYRVGLARMATNSADFAEAQLQIGALSRMNIGGRLEGDIDTLTQALKQVERRAATRSQNESDRTSEVSNP